MSQVIKYNFTFNIILQTFTMMNYKQITFRKPFGNVVLMSVMAVLAAFMTSCGGGTSSAPQHVKIIPKNAAIVVAFDVKQMVGKSVSFEDLFSQKSLEALGSNEKEAKEGADNAKKFMNSGVDYLNIGYMFSEGKNEDDFALAIPLDDAAKFEKFVKSENGDVKTEGKIKYSTSKKDGSFIAWKDKNAVIFTSKTGNEADFKKRAAELLELKDDQTLLATNKGFSKALGNKSDIQIWMDLEKVSKMSGQEAQMQGISLKDNFMSLAVKFEKGEVLIDSDYAASGEMAKLYEKIVKKGGIDSKLTKNVPIKKPLVLASLALNLKGIKEILQEKGLLAMAEKNLKKAGTSVDEIISVFSGDLLILAENASTSKPMAMVNIGLNDEKAFDKMIMKISKGELKKSADTYSMEDVPAKLIVKDGVAYVATDNYIEGIKKGKSELDGDMAKLAKDNVFAMYADEAVAKELPDEDMVAIKNVLSNVMIKSSEMKDNNMKGEIAVRMKDKSKNSLLVIIDAVKNAPKGNKKIKRNPRKKAPTEDDEPEAIDETTQQPANQ